MASVDDKSWLKKRRKMNNVESIGVFVRYVRCTRPFAFELRGLDADMSDTVDVGGEGGPGEMYERYYA